ncbi:hypothetical protein TNCT_508711 [Trichonephila clavata]|uniref:Uncharacterized protein n=1 Tax=Trichonephila clavata TaxID=2740835 RepID=A0A8X6G6U1_TRICU|nr:hypothetical protein TNCT_508711 [Trichonephila clavata]
METRQVLSKKENKTSRRRETEWECLADGFRCRTQFEVVVKSTHIQKEVKDIRRLPSPLIQRNGKEEENEAFINEQATIHSLRPNHLKHSPHLCPGIPDRKHTQPVFRQNGDSDKMTLKWGGEFAGPLSDKGKERFGEVRQQKHCNNSNYLNHNLKFSNEDDIISNENLRRLSPQSKKCKHDQSSSRNDVETSNQRSATGNKDPLLDDNLICSKTIQNKSLGHQSFECQKEDLKHCGGYNLDKESGHSAKKLATYDRDGAFLKKETFNQFKLSPNHNGLFSISDAYDMGRGDFLRQDIHCRDNPHYGQCFDPEQVKPHQSSDFENPYKISDEETMFCKYNKRNSTDIHKNQTAAYFENASTPKSKNSILTSKGQNETGIFSPNEKIGIKQSNSERFSSFEVGNVIFESGLNNADKCFGIHPSFIEPFSKSYNEASSFHSMNGCKFSSNRSSFKDFTNASDDILSDGDLRNAVFRVHSDETTKPQKNLPSKTISCLSHQNGTVTKRKNVLALALEKRTPSNAFDTELSWNKEGEKKISTSEITTTMVERTITPRTELESNEYAQRNISVGDLVEYFENLNSSCRDRKDKAEDKRLVQIHFVYEEKNDKADNQDDEERAESYSVNEDGKNKPLELKELQNHFVTDGKNQWKYSVMSDSKENLSKISDGTMDYKKFALPSESQKATTEHSTSETHSGRIGFPSPDEDILSESRAQERHFKLNDKQWGIFGSSREPCPTNAIVLQRTNSMPDFSKTKNLHSPRNVSNEEDLQTSIPGVSCDQENDKTLLNPKEAKEANVLKTQLGVQETEAPNTPKPTSKEKAEVFDVPHSEAVSVKQAVFIRQRKVSLADFPLENPLEKLTKSTHPDMRKSLQEAEGVKSTRRIFFIIRRITFIGFTILVVLLLLVSKWSDMKPSL